MFFFFLSCAVCRNEEEGDINVEEQDGDSLLRELDGLAHKHVIVAVKPLEIEVFTLNRRGYRLSGFKESWGS